MAARLEGANQLNEILFQDPIDSFPHRDNYRKITDVVSSLATSIEALSTASSGSEVVDARADEADLGTRITKGDEIQGDGVYEGVLSGFITKSNVSPDDKFTVKSGEALINGRMVRVASDQTIDPPNFTAGSLERIDVVEIGDSGTVGTVTGAEVAVGSGLSESEQPADNTVVLSGVFMRSEPLTPFAPRPIRDVDNGTDSFIIVNLQRFLVQRDRTDAHRHPANLLANGAFASVDVGGAISNWTPTREDTFVQESGTNNFIFSDNSAKFKGDGTAGGSFIEQEILSPESLRGKFLTVSAYLKLDSGEITSTGRITIRQVGDTPEQDFFVTTNLNEEKFQRLHITDYIDNSVTAVFVRIELDTTDPSAVAGFIEGVQCSIGSILTEFEWPERIRKLDDGGVEFPSGNVKGDLTFVAGTTTTFNGTVNFSLSSDATFQTGSTLDFETGVVTTFQSGSTTNFEATSSLTLDGTVEGDGAFDTEPAVLAWVGL